MNDLTTILVAVDFSPGSRAALEQAARIAGATKASLHVVHVVDQTAVEALSESHGTSFESQARISCEGASTALDDWLAQSRVSANGGVTILVGSPLHESLEHARKLNAGLLVAGIAGAGGSPAGAGSVSAKLARKAAPLVLMVRSDHPSPFRKIVACIDFSETAEEVAEQARRLALQDGASVDFLHVWQDPWVALMYTAPFGDVAAPVMAATPEQRAAYTDNLQRELHDFVHKAAQGIESQEILHEAANYGDGIVEHGEKAGADLIIVGAKGRTNLSYVLLGSTAERLLTRLPCSLLVVKPAALGQERKIGFNDATPG